MIANINELLRLTTHVSLLPMLHWYQVS